MTEHEWTAVPLLLIRFEILHSKVDVVSIFSVTAFDSVWNIFNEISRSQKVFFFSELFRMIQSEAEKFSVLVTQDQRETSLI